MEINNNNNNLFIPVGNKISFGSLNAGTQTALQIGKMIFNKAWGVLALKKNETYTFSNEKLDLTPYKNYNDPYQDPNQAFCLQAISGNLSINGPRMHDMVWHTYSNYLAKASTDEKIQEQGHVIKNHLNIISPDCGGLSVEALKERISDKGNQNKECVTYPFAIGNHIMAIFIDIKEKRIEFFDAMAQHPRDLNISSHKLDDAKNLEDHLRKINEVVFNNEGTIFYNQQAVQKDYYNCVMYVIDFFNHRVQDHTMLDYIEYASNSGYILDERKKLLEAFKEQSYIPQFKFINFEMDSI